ncbi:MAG: type II toxin-antitoxin system RelB/DinJ family antitoxin [Kiritimatiellae bacterium]|nr:type II toxin-antitoxin system RelB/DinJ family antitoxin [Kiritimatiellia bacterium]
MTTSLTIRMDNTLKSDAEEFFEDIGMNLTTAITCFFKKCLADGEIPFKLTRQRKEARLAAALAEAKAVAHAPAAPTCNDPDKIEEFMLS